MTDLLLSETAARTGAALIPLTDWMVLQISGPDRQRFLHSFCTQDINALSSGSLTEAFVTNHKGRILGHVLVLNAADSLLLLAVPGSGTRLLPHLKMYLLGLNATITDVSSEQGALLLVGPNAAEKLEHQLVGSLPQTIRSSTQSVLKEAATAVLVSRVDFLSPAGWLVTGTTATVAQLQRSLAHTGVVIGDTALWQLLRIETGFPWYGQDLSDEHLAQEAARTQRTISFDKGCYLGQEPIARLDALGHTNRELRVLQALSGEPFQEGSPVLLEDMACGNVTSIAYSPMTQTAWGLGVLKTKVAADGARLRVQTVSGQWAEATCRVPQP